MDMILSDDLRLSMYEKMKRIRALQLRIEDEYHLDEMKTPVHLCVGQEAVSVGVCANLTDEDYISSNHRSHGHYLAKGGDLNALVAELFCRETGCSKGRGGSMHLVDTSVGHMGSSSIVGGGIPIATGMALASKMKKNQRISVTFFGDGAVDEGTLYESVNFAMLKQLPVIFIYENNQVSVCSKVESRQAGPAIFHNINSHLLNVDLVDGNDVAAVYKAMHKAAKRARDGEGASFIECTTYRMRGHAGAGSDVRLGYRTQEELDKWGSKDPLVRFEKELRKADLLNVKQIKSIETKQKKELNLAFDKAKKAPLPGADQLHRYLYKE